MSYKKLSPRILGAGLTAAIALAAGTAAADSGSAHITQLLTKEVSVKSNGQSYTSVAIPPLSLAAKVHIELDAGTAGRIHSWKTWLRVGKEGLASQYWLSMKQHAVSKSYAWNDRPKTVDRVETVAVPLGDLKLFLVGQCNTLANQLRDQGLGNKAIFGQDREIELQTRADFEFKSGGAGSGSPIIEATFPTAFKLVCKKWQGSQVPTVGGLTDTPAEVTQASMTIFEIAGLNGACKVKLSNVIQTDKPNATVKFRYEHNSGKKSDVKTVMTDHAKTTMFVHQYDIPNGPGDEIGMIRMVGVKPGFTSAWKPYHMDCAEGGPGGLAPNPSKPKVVVPLGSGDLTVAPKPGDAPKPIKAFRQKRTTGQ